MALASIVSKALCHKLFRVLQQIRCKNCANDCIKTRLRPVHTMSTLAWKRPLRKSTPLAREPCNSVHTESLPDGDGGVRTGQTVNSEENINITTGR